MLRLIRSLAVICLFLLPLAPLARAAGNAFVAGVDDLPLMPGLTAVQGQDTVFDAPGGRIVESWAEGAVRREAVLSFYGSTLPQLGWVAAGPGQFRRDGEVLRLEFPSAGPGGIQPATAGTLMIRFYLSPG
jgi:hypothetical protein